MKDFNNFHQADEMEQNINGMAIKVAWVFSLLFLISWIGYDWIKIRSYNALASILLFSQLIVYLSVWLFLRWKLGKDEK